MRSAASTSALSRRLAAAVVLPGLLTSSLVLVQPASAAGTTSNSSICNGVVNQLAHRGSVQENLLKSAAKRNADAIVKLQAEKDALQVSANALKADVATAEKMLTDLEAQETSLLSAIGTAESEAAKADSDRAAKAAEVAAAEATLDTLRADKTAG